MINLQSLMLKNRIAKIIMENLSNNIDIVSMVHRDKARIAIEKTPRTSSM